MIGAMIRVLFILAVLLSTTPAATADPVDDYVRLSCSPPILSPRSLVHRSPP